MRAMTSLIATYNNQTLGSVTPSNDQFVTRTLGDYRVHTAPPPGPKGTQSSRFGHYKRRNANAAKRGAKRALEEAGTLPPKPAKPELRSAFTALRDYLEPFTCLDGVLDPVFNRIHEAAVAHGIVPPAEIPPATPSVPSARSLSEFLDSVAGRNFLCAIQGEPCFHRPGDLKGKVVVIGYLLDERDDIAAFRSLIEEHLREGDLVISPASKTDLQHPAVRDQACFGAPAEQCVAVAEDDIWGRTGEAVRKVVDLSLQRLRLIDPDYASQLEKTHRAEATEGVARFFDYQNAASLLSGLTPAENRAAVDRLSQKIDSAMREAESIGIQENAARGARYAARIRELTDREGTIFVPVPMGVADVLQMEFITSPDVLIVAPPSSAQRYQEQTESRS
jgi:hypothetical protein